MLKDDLETVVSLAKVYIKDEEKEKYLEDINKMLDYVKVLQELDVVDLEPTTHVTQLRNVWRDDVIRPCSREVVEQILKAAPEREGYFYKVQKVIESRDKTST
ncbi:MAG: Asp-tRNA(Asn)/Glu-tRNA(Gln) amidotransferase subunit GatC [Endomicrobium sp.]|jgi:aspartyl/glutamyl-tRNA(Asn/Gln) amidotransferase C subunit|nr:Asp-tRNA(Asn)/Glu-tRNA(Gln) amidotransferase subunit GatC [Endomicrobium sp.]